MNLQDSCFNKLLIILGSFMGVMIGGIIFISKHKHLLIILISLEIMALRLSWILGGWMRLSVGEEFIILFFLRMAACEGRMGLAVLVRIVRTHGRDKFRRIRVLEC